MKRFLFFLSTATILFTAYTASANIVTKGAREIVEELMKKGTKEASKELTEFGGKLAIQNILERASREGGDKLVKEIIRYGKKYGLSSIRTIDSSPAIYIKALNKLPEKMIERALWAAQREPDKMKSLITKYGDDVLFVAAQHRGVGMDIIIKLGNDGVRLSKDLTEKQAVVLARHADEITDLPQQLRSQLIEAMHTAPARVIDYIEKHPKVILSAAGIATLVALKDEVLGKDDEVVVNPDGSKSIHRRGFLERLFKLFYTPISAILAVIALVVGGWGVVKIWGVQRRERLKVARDEFRFEQEKKEHFDS